MKATQLDTTVISPHRLDVENERMRGVTDLGAK
jgi:hypothetical protein